MSEAFNNPVRRVVRGTISRGLIGALAVALLPLTALAADAVDYTPDYTRFMGHDHDQHHGVQDSALVRKVFDDNKKYRHFSAINPADGWDGVTSCVSGDETGAMGIHIVNSGRLFSGKVDPAAPAALIYEPQANGELVLVGVEFIVDKAAWEKLNSGTPSVDGHLMNFVEEPNRYGLHAFYEMHVWAFEENPKGAFADWNTHVTCEKQPLNFMAKLPPPPKK
ncbi:MAG: hypothetical protein ACJ8R9_23445 [Steroidobacteraceae bacterium]